LSPGRYRRTPSPGGRRPVSPGGRRPASPGGRRPTSPGGRRPASPGGRRPVSPGGRRLVSPGGRYSSGRGRRTPTPDRRRDSGVRPLSPRRGPYSPERGQQHRRSRSPVRDVRPDSTIPDSDLGQARSQFNASLKNSEFSNSPQRISLDERLERELGLKREEEALITGLPTTIPTYDNMEPPAPKIPVEKEQAMVAAQLVTTKLLEMQALKEAERAKKREQRMADRLASASLTVKPHGEQLQDLLGDQKVAAVGRILEQVEAQEQVSEEQKNKKKRKDDVGPTTLITLKPFYRPNEKKIRKKKVESPPQEDWPEYTDVPRSPVPLPDNSVCTPVLVKLGFGVSKEKSGKSVKYTDGVVPGQGSPDHSTQQSPKLGKRYKKVRLLVLCDKSIEDTLPPPPPPPGSPPRYNTSELIARYGQSSIVEASA